MFLGKNFQFFPKNIPKMREEREKMKFFLSPPAPSYTVTSIVNLQEKNDKTNVGEQDNCRVATAPCSCTVRASAGGKDDGVILS